MHTLLTRGSTSARTLVAKQAAAAAAALMRLLIVQRYHANVEKCGIERLAGEVGCRLQDVQLEKHPRAEILQWTFGIDRLAIPQVSEGQSKMTFVNECNEKPKGQLV